MKRSIKRLFHCTLAICILISCLCVSASAATNSSAYLSSYSAATVAKSNGVITVTVEVNGTGRMDKIGATDIFLYESTDGVDFYRVLRYSADDHPEMMTTNSYDYYQTPLRYNGIIGRYYYASVYVYAEKNGGSHERNYTTTIVQAHA